MNIYLIGKRDKPTLMENLKNGIKKVHGNSVFQQNSKKNCHNKCNY